VHALTLPFFGWCVVHRWESVLTKSISVDPTQKVDAYKYNEITW
jgi:hypothetical protein